MSSSFNEASIVMCPVCGNTPCIAPSCIAAGKMRKIQHGKDNKSVRYFRCNICTRDTYGALGKGQRIQLPSCVESMIKDHFPNEGNDPFAGFRDGGK